MPRRIISPPTRRPLPIDEFGGLATLHAPLIEPRLRGLALVSENCTYEKRKIEKVSGDQAVLENAVGAVKIEDFETDFGWSAGTRQTTEGDFVLTESDADGLSSRSLSQAGVGSTAMEKSFSPPLNLGMAAGDAFDDGFDDGFGSDAALLERESDVFHLWRKPLAFPATVTGHQVRLRFETSGGNHFQTVIAGTAAGEEPLRIDGGGEGVALYTRIRRRQFAVTGAPDWSSIAKVRIELEVLTGSGTLSVAFDNLYWAKGIVQDLFQFRRTSPSGLDRADEYAVSGGHLYKSDGRRWVSVREGLDPDAVVHSTGSLDRRFVSDGITTPIKIMPDGAIYRMGIVTPPRQITLSEIAGALAEQDVYVVVRWYSNKTFIESAPDDRDGVTKITLSPGVHGVRVSNIPVSPDPQVTHVRVGLRPELLSDSLYFRASGNIDGEVENGITTFDFALTSEELVNFDVMDPDTDYPSVVLEGATAPEADSPLFLAEHGGRLLAAFPKEPGTMRFTPLRSPEYWPLFNALPLGEGDNDPISGIASGQDVALAFKRDAVYPVSEVGGAVGMIAGQGLSSRGTVSHKSIVRVGSDVWYAGETGIHFLDSGLRTHSPTAIAQPSWEGFWDPSRLQRMVAVEVRRRFQYVLYGWSTGALDIDRAWAVNYRRAERQEHVRLPNYSPSVITHGADSVSAVEDSLDVNRVRFARDGVVFQADVGTSRDGRGFKMRHRLGLIGGASNGDMVCFWPLLNVLAAAAGDQDLVVDVYVGGAFASPLVSPRADLQDLSAPLGSFVLGTSLLGASPYVFQELRLPPNRGRFIQIEVSHDGMADVIVFGLTPNFIPLTRRGGF